MVSLTIYIMCSLVLNERVVFKLLIPTISSRDRASTNIFEQASGQRAARSTRAVSNRSTNEESVYIAPCIHIKGRGPGRV